MCKSCGIINCHQNNINNYGFILLDEERYRQYIKASQFCSKEQPSKKSANKDITNVKLIKWIKKY